ncbi:MAG: two-component system response regulator CreB [Candidatus Polarisedimenticolia bacterium]
MKPRILIVEDEPAILDNIQYALESEGLETIRLSEGLPVLPLLERQRVDLILLDVGLPDVNGIDLCRSIRESHATPIIFLTARTGEIDRVVGLEIGGDDYVSKPFSPRELCARVKAVLRRTAGGNAVEHAPSTSGHPAFEVDGVRHRITYHGRPLELSRYEHDILATFVRHPGRVFSRDQLKGLVWEEPGTSLERSVDAHIKNLRAKLKAVWPDLDPIETHRGVGYSLKEDA